MKLSELTKSLTNIEKEKQIYPTKKSRGRINTRKGVMNKKEYYSTSYKKYEEYKSQGYEFVLTPKGYLAKVLERSILGVWIQIGMPEGMKRLYPEEKLRPAHDWAIGMMDGTISPN